MEYFRNWDYFHIFGLYTNSKMTINTIQDRLSQFAHAGTREILSGNKMFHIHRTATSIRRDNMVGDDDKDTSIHQSIQLRLF